MSADPALNLCEQLVTKVDAAWVGKSADDVAKLAYVGPVGLDRSQPFAGRRVFIFPVSDQAEAENRSEDRAGYSIAVWIVERYPDALPIESDEATAWISERVLFSWTVVNALDFGRESGNKPGLLEFNGRRVWTESWRRQIYDWERLVGLQLFMAELEFTFRELV